MPSVVVTNRITPPPEEHWTPLPEGRRRIHDAYGLWICQTLQHASYLPRANVRRRRFAFYCISHLTDGKGWYWTPEGGRIRFRPGQAVMVTPGTVMDYAGDRAPYVEDAICFHGPVADHLQRSGIVRDGIVNVGPARRLLSILTEAGNPSDAAQVRANLQLQNLLVELHFANQPRRDAPVRSRLSALLEAVRQQSQKWWSLDEMAATCHLSRNQFRRCFQQETGMSPKLYVDQLKISQAAEMLCKSDCSVAELAAAFGYADAYHFSRRFKDITGLAPQHYRLRFGAAGR